MVYFIISLARDAFECYTSHVLFSIISSMIRDSTEEISLLAYTFELSIILAVPVIIGAFCGYWIDQNFETGFSFLIIGILLGILVATILTVRKVSRVIKQADEFYEAKKKEIKREQKTEVKTEE